MSPVLSSVLIVALGGVSAIGNNLIDESVPFFWGWVGYLRGSTCLSHVLCSAFHKSPMKMEGTEHHALELPSSQNPKLCSSFIVYTDSSVWLLYWEVAQTLTHCHYSQYVFCLFNPRNTPVRSVLELFPFYRPGN